MMQDQRICYFARGKHIHQHTYTVAKEWQSWMGGQATPEDMPVNVLLSMRLVHLECASEKDALETVDELNKLAVKNCTMRKGKVVVP